MFDYPSSKANDRPRGALEVAMRVRNHEKAQTMVIADYRADTFTRTARDHKRNWGLLANLFAIFQ